MVELPAVQAASVGTTQAALGDVVGRYARQMRDHPFFIRGMQPWIVRLWERPEPAEIPADAYRVPSPSEREERIVVETADDLKALLP